jgi:hypothetical protein
MVSEKAKGWRRSPSILVTVLGVVGLLALGIAARPIVPEVTT